MLIFLCVPDIGRILTAKRVSVWGFEMHLDQFSVSHGLRVVTHPGAVFSIAAKTIARLIVFKSVALDTSKFALGVDGFCEKLVASDVVASQRLADSCFYT